MITIESKPQKLAPSSPGYQYRSMIPIWRKTRAVLEGEQAVKAHDQNLDTYTYTNLLIPFSPNMTSAQYAFYRAEAELPGLVSQYAKILIGGLLRKPPQITLSAKVPEEAKEWIENQFTIDDRSLFSFLDEALWAEMCSRAFVMVDYPAIPEGADLTKEERAALRPYPILWRQENVVNWREGVNPRTRQKQLLRVIIHDYVEEYTESTTFHPDIIEIVYDHQIDDQGYYKVDTYRRKSSDLISVENGKIKRNPLINQDLMTDHWEKWKSDVYPLKNDEKFTFIPGFFLDGTIQPREPIMLPMVNREIALYNKVSRRNHLLYTASTFTPVFYTSMSDEQFQQIASQGLGTFIRMEPGDSVIALETPTSALIDLSSAIQSTVEDLSRMGLSILTPDGATATSGVALSIRNNAQTSQLATLNNKVSQTMRSIVSLMISWRYDLELEIDDVDFTLSTDFNTSPIGEGWVRMVAEWYEAGTVPRSLFLRVAKDNDVIPPDYDDEEGQTEIKEDPVRIAKEQAAFPDNASI